MQRPSLDNKQKLADEVIVSNRFLSANPSTAQDNSVVKASPGWRQAIKPGRLSSHNELGRRDALSALPFKNCEDILEVRSFRHYKRVTSHKISQPSLITINVSGDRFQTQLSTLELYPETLLGNDDKRKFYWNAQTEEYFFDRNRACFEAILYYYQSQGRLRRPDFIPLDTFLEEIAFFELGAEATDQVRQVENLKVVKQSPMPHKVWRWYLWYYLEHPQHSKLARVINIISVFFTVLSCVALAIESLPNYTNHWDDICKLEANISLNSTYTPRCPALFYSPFFIIQTVCVAYFSIEFAVRLISTPSYPRFILSFSTWVDLSSIVPYFVFLAIELADRNIGLDTAAILAVRILRILRFSRVMKIYLVFQRLKSLRVLSATVKESLADFLVLITILTLLAFMFGAATYFAEQQTNGDVFDSIPKSIYWGIITITGVGYGDMCPITAAGRAITCLCALVGSATMGMLTSVLVDRYQRVFNRKMYVSEPDDPLEGDINNAADEDDKSNASLSRSLRRSKTSGMFNPYNTSIQQKRKADRYQKYKLQFVVSFNDDTKDRRASDQIVTVMKRKLTEAISTTDANIDLKLIDNENQELWTLSSSDASKIDIPEIIISTNALERGDKRQIKIVTF